MKNHKEKSEEDKYGWLCSIPTVFEYRKYQPKPDAKTTNDFQCVLVLRGIATNLSVGGEPLGSQLPETKTKVNDLWAPEPGVLYPIPVGKIPALTSSFVQNARRRAMRIQNRAHPTLLHEVESASLAA